MPITITITDPTPEQIIAIFGGPGEGGPDVGSRAPTEREHEAAIAAEKPKANPRKKPAPDPQPAPAGDFDPMEDEVEPPAPMPAGAAQVVDAGTGRPVGAAINEPVDEPVKQMTFEDVKIAAAKLAAKDTPALGAILKKYGAGKLSEVPKDSLGDFAGDVMEALG